MSIALADRGEVLVDINAPNDRIMVMHDGLLGVQVNRVESAGQLWVSLLVQVTPSAKRLSSKTLTLGQPRLSPSPPLA